MRAARAGAVVSITFDDPHAGLTLTTASLELLRRELDSAEADPDCRAFVLRTSGEAFCTGMDLGEAALDGERAAADGAARFFDLLTRFTTSRLAVVSVVRGRAVGGGVGIVAASDFVITEPRAQFALPEALWGLFPCVVLPFLVRRIGFGPACAMALATLPVPARRAEAMGLVHECADDPERAVRRLLGRLTRFGPDTVATAKRYCAGLDPVPAPARDRAVAQFAALAGGAEFRTAVREYTATGRLPWEAQD